MTAATATIGQTSAPGPAPENTAPSSQPNSASRAMPAVAEASPKPTAPAMRRRTPSVKAQSLGSKYTGRRSLVG